MKTQKSKILKKILIVFIIILAVIGITDKIILPLVVSGSEVKVPDLIGKHKDEAYRVLEESGLQPIVQTSRFDESIKRDHIMFQKPAAGITVKSGRRIYLTISGGNALIKVPSLVGKTVRDAQLTLDRMGLKIGQVEMIESEFPQELIVEQQYMPGREISEGSSVAVKVSIGPQIGMIRVPNILGKSLSEVESILKSNSLQVGIKTYIHSANLLPNTVVDQQPSENTLVSIGDSINVVLTQNKNGELR
jgi:eukaryotic-like serine/threonine-protein kinase